MNAETFDTAKYIFCLCLSVVRVQEYQFLNGCVLYLDLVIKKKKLEFYYIHT